MLNHEHKDRLFIYMFGRSENKDWILSLYNAVNGTDYADAEEIEITTIEDAVYMGMKNDASFLLHWTMSLWEHQSTFNPNMPVRELIYLGKLYDKYIHQRKANIYGKKVIRLPIPKLVVFYNGNDDKEDDAVLRLSDAFSKGAPDVRPDVDVRVRMLNINKDHNKELMAACRPLFEYAWFIQEIRDLSREREIEEAVDAAIGAMPEGFVIRDFLIGNRAEVKDMCITEYNEAETMQQFRAEGRAEGRVEGRAEGEDKLARLMGELFSAGRPVDAERAAKDAGAREKFYREFGIS